MFRSVLRVALVGCLLGSLAVCSSTPAADDKKPTDDKKVDLRVGDVAPTFESRTDRDTTWSSTDTVGKKWVVVYFYPGDFTPGCTAQARAFRDALTKLTEQGVEVVGVSGDSVKTHELFKKAQQLNFTLLTDEDGELAKKFGVPFGPGAKVKAKDADGKPIDLERKGTAARWTFVIGKDGKIAYRNTKVTPAEGAKEITAFLAKAEQK